VIVGGLSFFSSREGFICDNVVNFEVVLASGAIVNANEKENSDLFKVLKGGGNNFGIVTRFDMRTFQQGPFWGGAVFYFHNQFEDQINALVTEVGKPDASEETHIMISLFYAAQFGQVMGLNQAYYTQEVQNPPEIQPFVSMQPQVDQLNSMRMTTVKEAAEEQAAMAMTGVR
jgi:FAD/FMN-containing dehydrogenase